MPSSHQSQQEGDATLRTESPRRDEKQPAEDVEKPSSIFDNHETYFPVFFLVEAPEEFYDDLYDAASELTPRVEITSNSLTNVAEEIDARLGVAPAVGQRYLPFAGSTIDEVYDFFKQHLRPAEDIAGWRLFSSFSFIVVDAECLESDPWQCVLCCDAPDYGEAHDEIMLKQYRQPIAKVMDAVTLLEGLYATPSEWARGASLYLTLTPAPWHRKIFDEQGQWTGGLEIAPPGFARAKKKFMIEDLEEIARKRQAEDEISEKEEMRLLQAENEAAEGKEL